MTTDHQSYDDLMLGENFPVTPADDEEPWQAPRTAGSYVSLALVVLLWAGFFYVLFGGLR